MGSTEEPTFEIPKEGWAAVVKNEGPDFYVEVEKVPVPEIGPDDVLLRLNATGLCMSDVHFMLGDWGTPSMTSQGVRCAGHEGAGVIVKVGERVKNYKVGQRAGLKPTWDVCHVCEYCRSGREMYCAGNIQCGGGVNGSYQQYVVSPGRYTTIIPDGVSDYVAGPIMCSAATAYSAIKNSGIQAGEWAVFPGGGGGVGIQGVQLAAAMGLRALVIDTGEARRNLVLGAGAEAFVDFKDFKDQAELVKEVVTRTGGGAHACFVTAVQSYPIALQYLGYRAGASVICIGLPPAGKYAMEVHPAMLIVRGQSIKGSLISSIAEIDETLEFAKRGKLSLDPTVVGLSKFNESVQKLKNGEAVGRIVVDFNLP